MGKTGKRFYSLILQVHSSIYLYLVVCIFQDFFARGTTFVTRCQFVSSTSLSTLVNCRLMGRYTFDRDVESSHRQLSARLVQDYCRPMMEMTASKMSYLSVLYIGGARCCLPLAPYAFHRKVRNLFLFFFCRIGEIDTFFWHPFFSHTHELF